MPNSRAQFGTAHGEFSINETFYFFCFHIQYIFQYGTTFTYDSGQPDDRLPNLQCQTLAIILSSDDLSNWLPNHFIYGFNSIVFTVAIVILLLFVQQKLIHSNWRDEIGMARWRRRSFLPNVLGLG